MGKVITVWGSPGSGKSMFCCILAKALTRDKRKAIIINADMNVPMLPVWLPEQIIQTNTSIGQVLSSVEIDTSLVASHVTVLKNYPFIGMMGYAAGENPLSYPEVKYNPVRCGGCTCPFDWECVHGAHSGYRFFPYTDLVSAQHCRQL